MSQSPEIDLLLVRRKKMSDFNFVAESDDRILEYLGSIGMGPVCFKRSGEDRDGRRDVVVACHSYIYA